MSTVDAEVREGTLRRVRARLLRRDATLLGRIRWLFVVFNVLVAFLTPLDMFDDPLPLPLAALVLVSCVTVGLWALAFYARDGRPWWLEAAPFVLLFAAGIGTGDDSFIFGRLFVALFLQSLYRPGRRRLIALGVAYTVTYETVILLTADANVLASVVDTAVSVFVVAFIMQTVAVSIRRHELLSHRDQVLTHATAQLLSARGEGRLEQIVADGSLELVDDANAMASVWQRQPDGRLRLVALAGPVSLPRDEVVVDSFPEHLQRIYLEGRTALLDEDDLAAARAEDSTDDRYRSAVVATIVADGEPTGIIVIGSPEPLDPDLVDVLQRFANEVSLAQQLAERDAEAAYSAFHDNVTGLPNRALFVDRLAQALRGVARDATRTGVLLIDLDDFKSVNGQLGQTGGDELLIEVARRLEAVTRGSDTTSRLGADEFAILLDRLVDEDHAPAVADRVLETLREPFVVNGTQITISASAGLAVSGGDRHPDELMRNADAAMYASKRTGGDRWTFFHQEMHERTVERLALRTEIETAIAEEQFTLHYQPIVELETARITGFEALIRWEHPTRGMVPPNEFLGLAEETGLIVPIGRWVLRRACEEIAAWQGGPEDQRLAISVNLSAVQLQESVVEDVARALALSNLEPALLTLEVTETALLRDVDEAGRILAELKRLGVRIAVDDFGTGYSSLSHLQRFPIDVVKVDRSFVSVIQDGDQQAALTRAIVWLAAALDMDTVAEGVEQLEQAETLRRWNCRSGQGWLWSAALPAARIPGLLARARPLEAALESRVG